ncbi:hypothetical protein Droror1_Dr00001633 [Drosera rotundifolia]
MQNCNTGNPGQNLWYQMRSFFNVSNVQLRLIKFIWSLHSDPVRCHTSPNQNHTEIEPHDPVAKATTAFLVENTIVGQTWGKPHEPRPSLFIAATLTLDGWILSPAATPRWLFSPQPCDPTPSFNRTGPTGEFPFVGRTSPAPASLACDDPTPATPLLSAQNFPSWLPSPLARLLRALQLSLRNRDAKGLTKSTIYSIGHPTSAGPIFSLGRPRPIHQQPNLVHSFSLRVSQPALAEFPKPQRQATAQPPHTHLDHQGNSSGTNVPRVVSV